MSIVASVSLAMSRRNKTAAKSWCRGSIVVVVVPDNIVRNPCTRSVTAMPFKTVSAWERIPPLGDNKASRSSVVIDMTTKKE